MRLVAPSAPLAPYVRAFMVVEVERETTRVRLPEPGVVLAVRYRGTASLLGADGESRLTGCSLTGVTRTARTMRTAAGGGVVLAMFEPDGAARFFREPLHELGDTTTPLAELVPHSALDRAASQVALARSDAERVRALEAFLLARMRPGPGDPLVAAAVRAIREARGAVRVAAVADALGISQDRLEKRFRHAVGATPKQLASLLRLRAAVDAWRPGASLTQLALDAGYFDQSHFIREFRAATGEAPGRFLRAVAQR